MAGIYNVAKKTVSDKFFDDSLGLRLECDQRLNHVQFWYGDDRVAAGAVKRKCTLAFKDLKAKKKVAKRKETLHGKLPGNSAETAIEVDDESEEDPLLVQALDAEIVRLAPAPLDEIAQFYYDMGYVEVSV